MVDYPHDVVKRSDDEKLLEISKRDGIYFEHNVGHKKKICLKNGFVNLKQIPKWLGILTESVSVDHNFEVDHVVSLLAQCIYEVVAHYKIR